MLGKIFKWYERYKTEMKAFAELQETRKREASLRKARIREERRRKVEELEARERKALALNARARQMQVSLLQLPSSPDLKRQVSWVVASKDVPREFRRRQFGRFRNLLLAECTRMIRSGVPRVSLLEDLRAIAVGLGVASFEADYIINSIPEIPLGSTPAPIDPNVEFQQRILKIHDEHMARLKAIDSIQNLDEEVRLELVEAEVDRYRRQLFGQEEPA